MFIYLGLIFCCKLLWGFALVLVVTPVLLISNPALVVTRLGGKLGDPPVVVIPRLCLPTLVVTPRLW